MRYQCFCWLIALLLILNFFPSFGQEKKKTQKLFEIRQKFQKINRETNYQITKLEDAELIFGHTTDGGASITGYYKNDTLKKIIEWIGLSNKVIQNEYYFDSGKLIFVYATESQYAFNDSLQALDYTKFTTISNGRYYFENNRLFDVILSSGQQNRSQKADAARFLRQTGAYKALLLKSRN